MADFTQNYGLHQWEPTDPFLREDFNQDLSTIDAALGQLDRSAETSTYNVYNLMLQNDYDGKYTGYKKALAFDGFLDDTGIASKSGFLQSDGTLWMEREGQGDINLGIGGNMAESESTSTLVMTGCGTITGFSCWIYSYYEVSQQVTGTYEVTVNGKSAASGDFAVAPPPPETNTERTIPFSPVDIRTGDRCVVTLNVNSGSVMLRRTPDSNGLGGTLRVRAGGASVVTMTAKPAALPESRGAAAWVRHRGGTVSLSLKNGGKSVALTPEESRETVELYTGATCTEQAFRLDQPLAAGDWQVVLSGSLSGDESEMEVYDYGVVWKG